MKKNAASRPLCRLVGLAAGLLVSGLVTTAGAGNWDSNQCVACHEVEDLSISLGHSMGEWRASAHARGGVGCEKCHGGDASSKDAKAAHNGVLSSSDPKSMVNIHNLSATCGSCHEEQYNAYKGTVHAKEVKHDADAATCLTCHGSMATSYPSPRELNTRCSVCHDKPVEARSALSWLSSAKTHLVKARRALDEAKTVVPDWHAGAVERFHQMEKDYDAIALQWHKFDMEASIKQSRDLLNLGKLLEEEATLKVKMAREKAR